ncbi:WcaI family glycosyltransferase [Mucilaginibacter sp. SP1R1]|uniref:WcaI family glycosyltransferase n=1 Tax=Mucilaginibacter sp. SP1R1 TaxID=2723091 RepID=UPI0016133E65|nr:WcaI family glycosyltransferase [Mucilaginibacter sp. SP1R1]MBB6149566.1 colanic acid biosynthesis glycosyl transferase WcaI [Mucilaginibacter sp. SP1R1]
MLVNKSFLLISTNYFPEPTATGKYNGELIDWLIKKGHNCTVITTYPHYPFWKVQSPYKGRFFKKETFSSANYGKLTVYRCPCYIPSVPSGANRLLMESTFLFSSLFIIARLLFKKKLDYILAIAPPFHMALPALLYRFFKKAIVIFHIQDLQVDAAQGLGMLNNKLLFNLLYKIERMFLKKADFVSSISDGMIRKIKLKINREVILFPNWVDTNQLYYIKDKTVLKNKWGYSDNQFICLYSGGIGEKQGLDTIINAANLLKHNNKFKFIICGSGQYKSTLQQMADGYNLQNVHFLPLQDKAVFNEFLNMADLHLIIQKSQAGDLALPSKLTSILATGGITLVTANPQTSLYDLITKYDVGYICKPENPQSLVDELLNISTENIEGKKLNAISYARKHIHIDNVIAEFLLKIN